MKNKYIRILSIDGGGIRGIVPATILMHLERKIQKCCGNPKARLADYFDFLAGTSTGGIISVGLLVPDKPGGTRPKYTAKDLQQLYLENGGQIFHTPLFHKITTLGGIVDEKYPARYFEKALKRYFGDVMLSELLRPCMITAYNVEERYGHFFTQHDAVEKPSYDFYVRDVARATSAAPTYFECAKIESKTGECYPLIDGGVFVNNPALCAYAEVREVFGSPEQHISSKDMLIFSLGTGNSAEPYPYKDVKDWGMISWVKPLISIMMSGVNATTDFQLKQIFEAGGAPDQYFRINSQLPGYVNVHMDDASPENLKALEKFGNDLSREHSQLLDRLVDKLLLTKECESDEEPSA